MKCPNCKSPRLYVSRRGRQEMPPLLQVAVVRITCDACLTRFYRPRILCQSLFSKLRRTEQRSVEACH